MFRRTFILIAVIFGSLLVGTLPVAAGQVTNYPAIIALRSVERILVTLSGALCLFLGYRLFDHATELGNLKAEWSDRVKLQIQRVGPGVFFALFGTAILIFVMSSSVDLTTLAPVPQEVAKTGDKHPTAKAPVVTNIHFGGPIAAALSNKKKSANLAWALEYVESHVKSGVRPATPDDLKTFNDAITLVDGLKGNFVDSALGKGSYAEWQFANQKVVSDPGFKATLDKEQRDQVEAVDQLFRNGKP